MFAGEIGHITLTESMTDNVDPNSRFPSGEAGGINILILEDDLELQSSIRDFFVLLGYNVYTAKDGAEGIRQVLAMDFDAIVCDMIMPAFPGDKFYLATSRVKPHLCERFVFITGERSNSDVAEFICSVNGTVLYKPFRFDDLDFAINHLLEKRSIGQASDSDTIPRKESAEPEEGTEKDFFGTICSIDTSARRFVLHQGTNDRVWNLECAYPEKLEMKVMDKLYMRVRVQGTIERFANGKRQIVNVRSLILANGSQKSRNSPNPVSRTMTTA